jgi:hypothetical protein
MVLDDANQVRHALDLDSLCMLSCSASVRGLSNQHHFGLIIAPLQDSLATPTILPETMFMPARDMLYALR